MVEISVIITAYNRKQYYKDAVRSVLNQTLDNDKYEVILVANFDASEYAKEEGIRFVYSDKSDSGKQVFDGIKVAKGRIISFLDDDDMFTKEKLENVYEAFKSYQNLGVYRDRVLFFYGEKIIQKEVEKMDPLLLKNRDKDDYIKMANYRKYGFHSSSTFSILRELLLQKADILMQMKRAIDWFYERIFYVSKYDMLWDSRATTLYRLSFSSSMRTLDSLENYIKSSAERSYIYCLDMLTVDSMLPQNLKKIHSYEVSLSKVRYKFISKETAKECVPSLSDYIRVFKKSYLGSHKALVLASLLPYSLRKSLIRKSYEREKARLLKMIQ
ncbi:glycosyltransferase family A protein [Sulfurisphaera tokodaii]|uniref:Glycosyltransferase n=2 Tax=Sulfurisphaera tokodaii TaxID=111955 RepID=Q96YH7_SULTO|nr:glycosyltransferase family A protein [Sulfurisphaera tokodaii]BAB67300.1 putative glycosyltransferase [Sulfurisphaera tokodaii str. 7]HII73072.1 glycosyltransferase family 2 protein [Sulfurisphaera tokodaii]